MITIEIRNEEIRAIQVKSTRKLTEVSRALSKEMPSYLIQDLIDGNVEELQGIMLELLEELAHNYLDEQYTLVVNLEGILTQRLTIPKVKDKEIPLALNSALIGESIPMSADDVVAFAVLRDKNKEKYNVLTQVLNQSISDKLTLMFNELNIKLKYIDVSPNTIIKLFNRSTYFKSESPLKLLVDLSEFDVRYYQFKDNLFNFNYLENVNFEREDNYLEYFKDNIYQFVDEFGEYELDDVEIILMGDENIAKSVIGEYGKRFNISKFADGLEFVENYSTADLDNYINALGATLRNDGLLSSHHKFDVNLLDKKKVDVKSRISGIREVTIGGTVALVVALGFLGTIHVSNQRIIKDSEIIEVYINDPKVKEEMEYSSALKAKLSAFDNALNTMKFADVYFEDVERPYTSRVFYMLYSKLTPDSEITSVDYTDGSIVVGIETGSEASFMNYTSRLKKEGSFKLVTYSGYSGGDNNTPENSALTGVDGAKASSTYTGTIELELAGGLE